MTQVVRILGLRPSQEISAFQPPKPVAVKPGPVKEAAAVQLPSPKVMPPGKIAAPDVRGKTIREAAAMLQRRGTVFDS